MTSYKIMVRCPMYDETTCRSTCKHRGLHKEIGNCSAISAPCHAVNLQLCCEVTEDCK